MESQQGAMPAHDKEPEVKLLSPATTILVLTGIAIAVAIATYMDLAKPKATKAAEKIDGIYAGCNIKLVNPKFAHHDCPDSKTLAAAIEEFSKRHPGKRLGPVQIH